MRRYAGTDLCFVEVKLKDTRGATIKKRLPCSPAIYGRLDGKSMDFVRESYEGHYGKPFDYELSPSAQVRYRRMTLVAKTGGERMTVDSELEFDDGKTSCAISPGIHILETKSSCGNGLADRILRGLHQHPTKNCSKYCSGVALLQPGLKRNKFLPAIRKLSQLPITMMDGAS